ncbi:hypothetical protein AN958_08714, partial [Leucoagaricus sp. SymC.cos]
SFAATYTLIYAFLTKNSLSKTAEALKKEVKGVVVLKDGVKPEGPSLDDILRQWKTQQKKRASYVHYSIPECPPLLITLRPSKDDCTSSSVAEISHIHLTLFKASDSSSSGSSDSDKERSKRKAKAKARREKAESSSDSNGTQARSSVQHTAHSMTRFFQ